MTDEENEKVYKAYLKNEYKKERKAKAHIVKNIHGTSETDPDPSRLKDDLNKFDEHPSSWDWGDYWHFITGKKIPTVCANIDCPHHFDGDYGTLVGAHVSKQNPLTGRFGGYYIAMLCPMCNNDDNTEPMELDSELNDVAALDRP